MSDEITTPIDTQITNQENPTPEVVNPEVVTAPEVATPPITTDESVTIPTEPTPTNPIPVEPTPEITPETKTEEPAPVVQSTQIEVVIPPVTESTPTIVAPVSALEPINEQNIVDSEARNIIRSFLAKMLEKANLATKNRNQKRLETLTAFFETNPKVTNNMVEKLLKVSDSTATMYLRKLKNQGKIIQHGTHGSRIFYTKI